MESVGRESKFVINNVLFVALAVTMLLETTFPLLVGGVTDDRVSVGAPYFNRVIVPLGLRPSRTPRATNGCPS